MRAADIASRQQQVLDLSGHQAAIRDGVSPRLPEMLLRAGIIQAVTSQVVHVEIEVRPRHRPIVKDTGGENVLPGDGRFAEKVSRLADTENRCAADEIAPLKARHIGLQKRDHRLHLHAADERRPSHVRRVCAIDANAVGHVAGHHPRQARAVEQHMPRREWQMRPAHILNRPGRNHRGFLKATGEHRAFRVHARHLEHDGDRLHFAILLAPVEERRAGAGGDVPVARRIDDHARQHRLPSSLALQNDAPDRVALHDRRGRKAVQPKRHTGLLQHLQQACLE